MTKKYQYPAHHDKGDNSRLEKEVTEIKQTTKETNKAVIDLSKEVIELKTLLKTGNEGRDIQIQHLTERSKSNESRLDAVEEKVANNELRFENIDKRLGSIENKNDRIGWLIISTVILAVLGLIILKPF